MFRFSYLLSLWVNSALLLSDDLSLNKLRPTIQCIERTEPKLIKPNAIHFQTDLVYQMSTRKWSCQVNERIERLRELITFGKSKDSEAAHQSDMENVKFFTRMEISVKIFTPKRVNFRQNQFFDKARKSSFLIIYSVSRWKTLAVEWHWWLYLPQPSGHFRVCLVCQFIRQLKYW